MLFGKPKWNNVVLAYLVPPRAEFIFQSPRILVFSRSHPGVEHKEGSALPGKITHDAEIMRRELSDPDHLPCFVVQIDEDNQFMLFTSDDEPAEVHRLLNARIDEVDDKAVVINQPSSPLVLPGQTSQTNLPGGGIILPSSGLPAGQIMPIYSGDEVYRIEIDWSLTEESDSDMVNLVRSVAFGAKII